MAEKKDGSGQFEHNKMQRIAAALTLSNSGVVSTGNINTISNSIIDTLSDAVNNGKDLAHLEKALHTLSGNKNYSLVLKGLHNLKLAHEAQMHGEIGEQERLFPIAKDEINKAIASGLKDVSKNVPRDMDQSVNLESTQFAKVDTIKLAQMPASAKSSQLKII